MLGKRAKNEAISFVREKGYALGEKISYANKQSPKNTFWLNPRPEVLQQDWDIILNDHETKELIVLHVPAFTFSIRNADKGDLFLRKDFPLRIDLYIDLLSLRDRHGYADFSHYVVARIKY